MVLCLVVTVGAVTVASNDSVSGSGHEFSISRYPTEALQETRTKDAEIISNTIPPLLPVVNNLSRVY